MLIIRSCKNLLMKRMMTPLFALLVCANIQAQQKQDVLNYIEQYKSIAIEEMVRAKIPASITIAQGIVETGSGSSSLAKNANNHFGIKCKEEWKGKKYYHNDDLPNECFRVYENARSSYSDHSDFLMTRPWYAPLWQFKVTDYKSWAHGLKSAGYATNPQYASMLINMIEEYKLYELDQQGLAMIEEKERMLKQGEKASDLTASASKVIVTDVKKSETDVKDKKEQKSSRPEFTVNGLRAVKSSGTEDPLKIAFEYNLDYSYVLSFNDLNNGDKFKDGEFIFLQPKKSRGSETLYTAKAGENMHDISQKTGIKLRDLYAKNQMKMNDQVYPGEALWLMEKREAPPRTMSYAEYLKTLNNNEVPDGRAANNIRLNKREYQVQQSDTLHSIAGKFNTTVEKLKEANSLESAELRAGQTLVIAQ